MRSNFSASARPLEQLEMFPNMSRDERPPTKKPVAYISGPMTGRPDYNKAEFAKVAAKLREEGWRVLSPPELDAGDHSQTWEYYIRRDIRILVDEVEAVFLLRDWQESRGARLEVEIAKAIGLPLFWGDNGEVANV